MPVNLKRRITVASCSSKGWIVLAALGGLALSNGLLSSQECAAGERVVRKVFREPIQGEDLLRANAWGAYEKGYSQGPSGVFVCDNGSSPSQRGATQTVILNQTQPFPIVAYAESAAEGVQVGKNADYSLYLDLVYQDGTPLWGQSAPFSVGTHDWETVKVVVFPEKPIQRVSVYLLFRGHSGRALFRNPRMYELKTESHVVPFDGVPCLKPEQPFEGFSLRDVAAGSDFVALEGSALGLQAEIRRSEQTVGNGDASERATIYDLTLRDGSGRDRAVTVAFSVPDQRVRLNDAQGVIWCGARDVEEPTGDHREYLLVSPTRAGTGRGLSRWPVAAITGPRGGLAVGIDMSYPAVFRCGYSAGMRELFVTYDLAFTKEKPEARLRLLTFEFDPKWGFREAWDCYMRLLPEHFARRLSRHGMWMPFAKISKVPHWQDFGFAFKEGDNETAWDDEHGIITFRYTEPMTWWKAMSKEMPRTYEAAVAFAEQLAAGGDPRALAWRTSSFRDAEDRIAVQLRDTPWCDGAVWSMCSLPQISGDVTDFKLKWNDGLRERLYGPNRTADLDGEYIDSSEGYVTDELDFRRDHFVGDCPLTFDSQWHRPAVFRGLIAYEYIRAIARDVHGMGKSMMANGTPYRLCWLVPLLDVAGTETNWNPRGQWRPMSVEELLYRRALCGPKPYCFLQNTEFEQFGADLVERYMKRSLAFGMFPGFFSADASTGHYFTRPELFERDRSLFCKYVPLCRLLSESGWRPVTGAKTDSPGIHLERFGQRYLTVLNASDAATKAVVEWTDDWRPGASVRELVTDQRIPVADGRVEIRLNAEDVAVLDLQIEP